VLGLQAQSLFPPSPLYNSPLPRPSVSSGLVPSPRPFFCKPKKGNCRSSAQCRPETLSSSVDLLFRVWQFIFLQRLHPPRPQSTNIANYDDLVVYSPNPYDFIPWTTPTGRSPLHLTGSDPPDLIPLHCSLNDTSPLSPGHYTSSSNYSPPPSLCSEVVISHVSLFPYSSVPHLLNPPTRQPFFPSHSEYFPDPHWNNPTSALDPWVPLGQKPPSKSPCLGPLPCGFTAHGSRFPFFLFLPRSGAGYTPFPWRTSRSWAYSLWFGPI
jgi:hypothetical protein